MAFIMTTAKYTDEDRLKELLIKKGLLL